jgi:ABC-2 type transport system ATP-binding protein
MDGQKAVTVKNLSKIFRLPVERHSTLKSALINFSGRPRFIEQKALNKISFEVEKGEFFGIIGRNGSGKSTMLKLLAEIYTPSSGELKVNGNLTPFIELGVGFNPELTGRENVFLNGALLGFSRKEMHAMYQDIVDFAEIEQFMDQKLKNYSSGMQVRLAFSIAIRAQSDILLIDEVLAVGDLLFQQKCYETFKEIKKQGRTVIFVSHDLGAVDSFCDRVLILNRGDFAGIGEPKEMIAEYKSLLAREESEAHKSKGPKHIVSTGKTSITKAEILVAGKVVKEVPEGSPFSVRIHYDAKQPFQRPTFGFGLMDLENNSVLGPNTKEASFTIDEIDGRGYIEAAFETNVLSPGPYKLRAGIFDESGAAPEDFVEDLVVFKISGKARYGQTYIEPKWRLGKEEKS